MRSSSARPGPRLGRAALAGGAVALLLLGACADPRAEVPEDGVSSTSSPAPPDRSGTTPDAARPREEPPGPGVDRSADLLPPAPPAQELAVQPVEQVPEAPGEAPGEARGPVAEPVVEPAEEPVSVEIPSIDVSSELLDLGIDDEGGLEVPEDSALAGWFTGGGRPGGDGPVVVAGHVDSAVGPAVFYRLGELEQGDEVELASADGSQTTYRVDRVEDHAKDEFPTADVFGATTGDQLRVITCGGAFDRSAGSYVENVVVFATAV